VPIETSRRLSTDVRTPTSSTLDERKEDKEARSARNDDRSNISSSETSVASTSASRGLGGDGVLVKADGGACLLLLVCRGARPQHLVEHLYAMATRHGAPCLTLPMPSTALGQALGLKTCMAIAVKEPLSSAKPIASISAGSATSPTNPEVKSDNTGASAGRLMKRFVSDVLALPQNGL